MWAVHKALPTLKFVYMIMAEEILFMNYGR